VQKPQAGKNRLESRGTDQFHQTRGASGRKRLSKYKKTSGGGEKGWFITGRKLGRISFQKRTQVVCTFGSERRRGATEIETEKISDCK